MTPRKPTPTPESILRAARELISDPARWTQGNMAKSAFGNSVPAMSRVAVCWCAAGAVAKVSGRAVAAANTAAYLLDHAATYYYPRLSFVYVNDSRGHEAILKVFDRAIELAKQAQANTPPLSP